MDSTINVSLFHVAFKGSPPSDCSLFPNLYHPESTICLSYTRLLHFQAYHVFSCFYVAEHVVDPRKRALPLRSLPGIFRLSSEAKVNYSLIVFLAFGATLKELLFSHLFWLFCHMWWLNEKGWLFYLFFNSKVFGHSCSLNEWLGNRCNEFKDKQKKPTEV